MPSARSGGYRFEVGSGVRYESLTTRSQRGGQQFEPHLGVTQGPAGAAHQGAIPIWPPGAWPQQPTFGGPPIQALFNGSSDRVAFFLSQVISHFDLYGWFYLPPQVVHGHGHCHGFNRGGSRLAEQAALINSGCTRCLSHRSVVECLALRVQILRVPIQSEQMDESILGWAPATHVTEPVRLEIGKHWEDIRFIVADAMTEPLLIGQ